MSEQTFFAELFDRVFYEQHPLVIETMILCREPALGPLDGYTAGRMALRLLELHAICDAELQALAVYHGMRRRELPPSCGVCGDPACPVIAGMVPLLGS